MSVEDTCKPGDPDPTTLDYDDQESCPSRHEGWWCARALDHPGQHVAGISFKVVAVWQ